MMSFLTVLTLMLATSPLAEPTEIKPVAVTASSHLPPWKDYTFGAENLIDGRVDTSWQPKVGDTWGVGAWVQFDLGATYEITDFELANGFQREDALGDLYCRNNRLATGQLLFDDGSHAMVLARVDKQTIRRPVRARHGTAEPDGRPPRTRFVRFWVTEVGRPLEWKDLAISELRFFGRAVPTPPAAQTPGGDVVCGTAGWSDFLWALVRHCAKLDARARGAASCYDGLNAMLSCDSIVDYDSYDEATGKPDGEPITVAYGPLPAEEVAAGRVDLKLQVSARETLRVAFTCAEVGAPWEVASVHCQDNGRPCSGIARGIFNWSARDPCFEKYPEKAKKAPPIF